MENTKDRIIRAAIELVDEKGYKGATTRAIAERAEVNEVTLFRHFGNKKGILDAAIQKYSFFDEITETMRKGITWNLEKDLKMLSEKYQEIVASKRNIILISLREEGRFPELDEAIQKLPTTYRNIIKDYFITMIEQKKMKKIDPEVAANNFIYFNFGYFFLQDRLLEKNEKITLNKFTDNYLSMFIDSLK
ncbi:TetR/AcrR family transcriptional regulator [Pseudogracilibacillus sp. SE30717A]|uniref:TetR/AcrR family transcriptional regulator n=1 Tax=Pseudogracilibacillus sp. SE30717A TaxID=3098293 RepID=UPI00300E6936